MSTKSRGVALLVIQCLLVASIGVKYLYERATRPRVWVRVAQYDPNLPMRGRYMALTPLVNACQLPRGRGQDQYVSPAPGQKVENWYWRVTTKARDGKLVVDLADNTVPRSETQSIYLTSDNPCDRVALTPGVDFFIPDTAEPPFPKKAGQELWAEVTVPAAGPPRPIQLAMSENGQWKVLKLD